MPDTPFKHLATQAFDEVWEDRAIRFDAPVRQLEARPGVAVVRCFVGAFMTSMEMQGVSISVLRATPLQLARLDAPTAAPAWVPAEALHPGRRQTVEAGGGLACGRRLCAPVNAHTH